MVRVIRKPFLQAEELRAELVQRRSESDEATQALEQAAAELAAERAAAMKDAERARQALAAAQVQLAQLRGEVAATASERAWAQESCGALQVS